MTDSILFSRKNHLMLWNVVNNILGGFYDEKILERLCRFM